ncbi:hypothetical protein B0H14DRAFT_2347813 [Mycena olivaceomarginata]|nr:hypothetical protein B0H14DRAFT_2347813 [Mycena olivaceomarginata]
MLAPKLTKAKLQAIASFHGITPKRRTTEEVKNMVSNHVCTSECPDSLSVFERVPDRSSEILEHMRVRKQVLRGEKRAKIRSRVSQALKLKRRIIKAKKSAKSFSIGEQEHVFPPDPVSAVDEHRIISGTCKAINPENFEEAGCAVCGLLVPFTELTPKAQLDLNYDVLTVLGVTRKERKHSEEPIEEVEGPVMAEECDYVCADCEARLLKNIKPLRSLANHLWVGKVLWQLKDLSYAEKMLVAKVRHNRCVVRVASGRGKLSSNAIMFANPTVKVYNTLPPTKDELSEVLAFVFLGPSKPTEDEFKRTPMLVRRERVKTALDWLKLNHSDYATLEISPENLADLPEHGIPCSVEWKQTKEGGNQW